MLRIRLTIPQKWKQILAGANKEVKQDEILYNRLNSLKTLKTKTIYWEILSKHHDCSGQTNTHINWMSYYSIDDSTLKNYYLLPYKITRWTTLQALQYKIIYKIINCNYWLHKIKIIDSPKCHFCDKEENLMHFLFSCNITKQFWHAMFVKDGVWDTISYYSNYCVSWLFIRQKQQHETRRIDVILLFGDCSS
jgi:hypothetical protein